MGINNADLKIAYEVSYESFLAGALLVLPSVDSYDKEMLCKELALTLHSYDRVGKIAEYVDVEDDKVVSLKDGLTLDSVLEEGCTVREKLREIAGDKVIEYFGKFSLGSYLYNKDCALSDKQEIIDKAGVLLISETEETYDRLLQYGFKNVDYFRSKVRADKYFKEHPDELKKYHLILIGKHSIGRCTFNHEVDLDEKLRKLWHNNEIFYESSLESDIFGNGVEYMTYIPNYAGSYLHSRNLSSILNSIIDRMYSLGIYKKTSYKGEFKPIEDVVVDKLPLPTKKGDLKILCLDDLGRAETEKIMSLVSDMGLNVTFIENNNCTLGRIKDKLGEYDIIVAGEMYSRNLLNMVVESTEQCKDTGRSLTLLATYEEREWWNSNDVDITLKYAYAGDLASQVSLEFPITEEFRLLCDEEDRELKIFAIGETILSTAVHVYNKALPVPLTDLDLKTPEEYREKYQMIRDQKEAKKTAERNAIESFDEMAGIIKNYLNYRRSGLIERNPNGKEIIEKRNGIRIIQLGNGIKLENYRQGEMNFTIVFPLIQRNDGCRVFSMKIKDSDYESASLYVGEEKANVPTKANEYQLKVLSAFEELVKKTMLLLPISAQKNGGSSRK